MSPGQSRDYLVTCLSGSQLPGTLGMGCFLRAGCNCLLPVRQQLFGDTNPESSAGGRGTMGMWMPEGNRHLCCQWKQDGARGSEQFSHDGDELPAALPYPHCKGL